MIGNYSFIGITSRENGTAESGNYDSNTKE